MYLDEEMDSGDIILKKEVTIGENETSGELSYSGQYKAYSHIAPYITPESKIVEVLVAQANGERIDSQVTSDAEKV